MALVGLMATLMMASPIGAIGDIERPHGLSADGSVVLVNDQLDGAEALVRHESGRPSVSLGGPVIEVAVSSDASVVATVDASQTLRVTDAGGSSVVNLPVPSPVSNLVLSGDGRFLSFAAPSAGTAGASAGLDVHRLDRTTNELLRLPGEAGLTTRPIEMSEDGSRILVWRGTDTSVGQLGVFDVADFTLTKVTVDALSIIDAALTPDGSSVFFLTDANVVGGVGPGIHLYQTTLADRLIQLVPVGVELNDSAEMSATGQIIVQRSNVRTERVQVIDRRSGAAFAIDVVGATTAGRVTPIEVSDDLSTVLVAVDECSGGLCTTEGPLVRVLTGVHDPLSLRWSESDRPLFDSLDRLYLAVMGRPVDAAGRDFWIGQLVAGASLETVAVGLLGSPEGSARFTASMTPEAAVDRALSSVLGRDAAAAEIAAIVAGGGTTSKAALVVAAAQSPEAVAATATAPPQSSEAGQLIRLYRAVFGRFPDQAGYRYWADQQGNGLSLNAMIDSFAVSAEYEQRFGADPSDELTIAQLYRNVLGRESDAAGAAYWREQLANGASRNVMLQAFVDSSENIRRTGTQP